MRPLPTAALLLAALASGSCGLLAAPRTDTVLLLHTNDLHGHIEKAATLAGLARAERGRRPDVLWLDAGDMITGTPVSTVFQGTPIFSVTSTMGIDAGTLGNHEFDHGWERIALYREAASYPLLCANARSPKGRLLADAEWHVFDVDGVRVGVIGLVTEHTPAMTVKRGNADVRFEPAKAALERLVPVVRPQCDLLVALTHLGHEDDVALARSVKGVDVIVGGHSHTDLPGPVKVGDTLVVQAWCYGQRLGRLELEIDLETRRITRWEGESIVVDTAKQPSHEATARLVASLEARVADRVDVEVATAPHDLDKTAVRDLVERVMREALDADLGLQNDGGIRGTLAKGPIRIRDIWTVFPFDNTIVRVRIRGEHLTGRLRRALGDRWRKDAVYTVATNSFVADHLQRHLRGAEPKVEDSGIPVRDAVVDWVREHGLPR